MYSRIFCAVDGSELSSKALDHAIDLAKRLSAKLTLVTVTDPSIIVAPGAEIMMVDTGSVIEELEKAKAQSAEGTLREATRQVEAGGWRCEGVHVANSPAAEGILHAAKEHQGDLIVMGSHGRRGLGRLLLGSQAAEVLAHSDIPVLIVK
ncbi:MAG: universal stress protein [Devosia sp.]|uniref:universal stress protein n=1 Tax=Devosia sp. TaxID=1871048 RepID=UPI0024C6B127|nr:universal stress protein [Devosia sp.]UYN99732.1 MAG: universal stress protein [Devosia sp.]